MIVDEFTSTIRLSCGLQRVTVRLVYCVDDPVAVRLDISAGQTTRTWRFARSLLADAACLGVAGLGFVRVCRVGVLGSTLLWTTLDGANGSADLALPGDRVARWLALTEELSPVGSEHVDVDGLAWRLVTEAPAGRLVAVAGDPATVRGARSPGALVWTRPGRARSRRHRGEDPVDRPPRNRATRSRLGGVLPGSDDDDGDEQAGSSL
jgi:hypothetical protein